MIRCDPFHLLLDFCKLFAFHLREGDKLKLWVIQINEEGRFCSKQSSLFNLRSVERSL